LRDTGPLYNITEEHSADYNLAQETGRIPAQIFIEDKRQYINITNYHITNLTGQEPPGLNTTSTVTEPTYILESQMSHALLGILREMEEALDDPASFEQKLSKFLSLLNEFDKRKTVREIHFSDLLSMLRMAMVKIECNDLTKSGVSVFADAVNSLSHKVTQDTLRTVRNNLRQNGIDLLKPFKTTLDAKSILEEIYPNEGTS
jgi:hypothetical protein